MTIDPADVLDLDLAALMCSKVCHDVIGPVGAIINGLEVLDDGADEEMREVAYSLIRKSAVQASVKLQFCRLAFGASGSASAALDLGDAEAVTRAYVDEEKVSLDWSVPPQARPKNEVKLLLNLVLLAYGGIPKGGTLTVRVDGLSMCVTASGDGARVPQTVTQFLAGTNADAELDARTVQVHYTVALARHLGLDFTVVETADGVEVAASPRAAAAA
jgi:histidine phosphotransferase ChpT